MPLKLKLRAGESLYLSGALIRNGSSNTELEVLNKVPILREKDIMLQDQATTPCKQVYFALQTLYLEPESEQTIYRELSRLSFEILKAAPSTAQLLEKIHEEVTEKSYFRALKTARELCVYEGQLIEHAKSTE
ncbi:MAG: flagellar biosynthesis repressor FlbT [Opitutales bacterium]